MPEDTPIPLDHQVARLQGEMQGVLTWLKDLHQRTANPPRCVGKLGLWFGHRFKVEVFDDRDVLVDFLCTRCGRRMATYGLG